MKKLNRQELKFIQNTITTAGKRLLKYYPDKQILKQKYSRLASVVTQADIDTENFLRKQLAQKFPQIGFYSEETYQEYESELKKDYVWVVDPIDGTLNFSRGLPLYGIAVALLHQSKPEFGALYFPYFNEYYWALKSKGAYLKSERLSVRKKPDLNKLFGACASLYSPEIQRKFVDLRIKLNFETSHTFCTVSNFAHTAAGHYDFVLSVNAALWDIATGWILVEEAGGDFDIFHKDEKRLKQGNPYHLWCLAGPKNVVNYLKPALIQTMIK